MTDINEAIARWMDIIPPDDGITRHTIPAYDRSLDAQVPVWEALAKKHDMYLHMHVEEGYFMAELATNSTGDHGAKSETSPAEAAARAIHATLVVIGELSDD